VESKAHWGSSLEGQLGLAEIISFWGYERYGLTGGAFFETSISDS
jgi:hypothetical protein